MITDQTCRINIGKNGTISDMKGLAANEVSSLFVFAEKKSDLRLLSDYPNVETLLLSGKISELDSLLGLKNLTALSISRFSGLDFSRLKGLSLKTLMISGCDANENFQELFSGTLKYLYLGEIKKAKDLSFVEKAAGIEKLYLKSISAAETLPDFRKIKHLRALKFYELHKLNDMEKLSDSGIEHLSLALVADEVSGTRLADILLRMKNLKQVDAHLIDRNSKRYSVLKNRLTQKGKASLLVENLDYGAWIKL